MHRNSHAATACYLIKYTPVVIPYAEKIHDDAGKRTLMNLRGFPVRLPRDGMTDLACTYLIMNFMLSKTSMRLYLE